MSLSSYIHICTSVSPLSHICTSVSPLCHICTSVSPLSQGPRNRNRSNMVLLISNTEISIKHRRADSIMLFLLHSVTLKDTRRLPGQEYLLWTPEPAASESINGSSNSFGSSSISDGDALVKIKVVMIYGMRSPLYLSQSGRPSERHGMTTALEFARLNLNIDCNTFAMLRPFVEVHLITSHDTTLHYTTRYHTATPSPCCGPS